MFSSRYPVYGAFVSVLCASFAGCQTQRVSENIGKRISYVQTEVGFGRADLVEAARSLKVLRDAPAGQLKSASEIYAKSVGNLEAKAGGVGLVLNTMDNGAEKYFARWDKALTEIADDDVRGRAEDRKAEMKAAYRNVQDRIAVLRASFRPLMAKMNDIQKAMSSDPSPAGKSAVAPAMRDVLDQEPAVLRDIDAVVDALEKLKSR